MSTNEPRAATLQEDEINILDLVSALWAGKFWVIAATVVALAIGAFAVLRAQPLYQAQGLLQLETRTGALSLPENMQALLGDGNSAQSAGATEMEILKSRMIMRQVVEKLNLQIVAEPRVLPVAKLLPERLGLPDIGLFKPFRWGNEAISVGLLEVPEAWLDTDMTLRITDAASFEVELPSGAVLSGRVQAVLTQPESGFALRVDALQGPVGREFLLARSSMSRAVRAMQENFGVAENPRGSSILRVTFTAEDPRKAEQILDAIAQSYVSQNISRSAAEAENSLAFIEQQLPEAEAAVRAAQDALNAYRQQQGSVDVDFETQSLLERAIALEAELNRLVIEEQDLKDRYTVNHPTYKILLDTRANLQAQLEDIRNSTTGLPETQKEIFNLTRNLDVTQAVYEQLLNRAQELRVLRASTVGSVRIIDTADSDGLKVSPKTSRTLAIALLAGLLIGAGIVLMRRALRRGIKGAQEIEQTGLPVFATVNFAPEAANHRKTRGKLPILALTQPDHMTIEALRSLRTSLHFGMLDAQTNTILLTSAAPGVGKSFTSVNLAAVAAQAGQKVCLIDADLRKGYLRRYLGVEKGAPGLAELLAREKTLDEVLMAGPVDGLSFITSGRYPPNPSELLMRSEFEQLLQTLNDRFDLILIDSPPALAVTDPVVIGRYTGATILVVRHLETMLGEVEAVRRAFETAGGKLTGAILNGYRVTEGSKYGGQYHYYNYRYSYRSGQD